MLDDVAAVEAAEASIDAFINRRSAIQEEANRPRGCMRPVSTPGPVLPASSTKRGKL